MEEKIAKMFLDEKGDVILEENRDYILKQGGVWITTGNISVHIIKTDEGVICDMYGLNRELDNPVACTWALFSEAEEGEE